MRRLLSFGSLLFAAVLAAATLQRDVSADIQESTVDPPLPDHEYTTETPITPAPGSETPQKDPFKPYDVGDPASVVHLDELTPAQQAVVERGRNVDGWNRVHAGYAAATLEISKRARAEAAAHQLGIDSLETEGVVP